MNLPNRLTILRIILTFGFMFSLSLHGLFPKIIAALIFWAASMTDYLDGHIAKKYNLVSDFGKIMDPIADKFLMLAAFFIFVRLAVIDGWMFAVIAAREIFITVWRLVMVKKGKVFSAQLSGKIKTVLQIAVISLILLYLIAIELTNLFQWPPVYILWLYRGIYYLMFAVVAVTVSSGISLLWHNRGWMYGR